MTALTHLKSDPLNSCLYRLAWWASMRNIGWLHAIIFRYRCPHPISHYSPRACFAAGECGCDNADRFR